MQTTLRDYVPESDWVVELDDRGSVHISLNVQRDAEHVWIKPEHWDAIVAMVAQFRRAQNAVSEIMNEPRLYT